MSKLLFPFSVAALLLTPPPTDREAYIASADGTMVWHSQRYGDVELVTISTDANWDAVSSVIPERSGLQVLFDPDRSIVRGKYGTRLYPETWIVDKEGLIRARIDGARDWSSPLALELINSYR